MCLIAPQFSKQSSYCYRGQFRDRPCCLLRAGRGKYPYPGSTGYSASKFAEGGLSNGLRLELKHDSIHVTAVYPSLVNTPMVKAHLKSAKESFYYRRTVNYSPAKAAGAIVRAVSKKKRELIIPPPTGLSVPLYGLFPGFVGLVVGKIFGEWPAYDEPEYSQPACSRCGSGFVSTKGAAKEADMLSVDK